MTARTTTQGFFDPATWTISYVVWEHATRHAAVIDPVLDYDFKSGHTGTASADELLAYVRDQGLIGIAHGHRSACTALEDAGPRGAHRLRQLSGPGRRTQRRAAP